MRILGLIPARCGSKRLPGKNIKSLGGMPLIAWSIRSALESDVCVDVVVSTDDPDIAEVSREYGATTPWIRPAELATDVATSVDVAIHALDAWEASHGPVDGLMLLQPTSPFRSAETIQQAASMFRAGGGRPVVGMSVAESHPAWCFHLENDELVPLLGWEGICQRTQDLQPVYEPNGAIYIVTPDLLRGERTFFTPETRPLIVSDPAESLDIDSEWDWMIAKAVLRSRKVPEDVRTAGR